MDKQFWKAAGIRAAKTFIQVILAVWTAGQLITDVDWKFVLISATSSAIYSLLTSLLAGLPEVDIRASAVHPSDEFVKALKENGIEILDKDDYPEGIGGSYTPRLSAPSTSDKNWIHYSKGGYNYCILISGKSCLPNCVGYAWGRWRELLGKRPDLSLNNAEDWWAKNDCYKRGQTPKLGAVACWRKGRAGYGADGAGHVAVVEKISSDGTVTFGQSGYGYKRFYITKMKGSFELGGAYKFQGFIYLPDTEEEKPKTKGKAYSGALPTVNLKKGSKGENVKKLQKFLNWFGNYKLDVDGGFGPLTEKAVRKFQRAVGIEDDGIVGPVTRNAMKNAVK